MSDNLFSGFKDLSARQETVKPQSESERVLEVEREILEKYKIDKRANSPLEGEEKELYESIFNEVQQSLKEIVLKSSHLQDYISARDNIGFDTEAVLRGMYSGSLLELACTQTKEEICIDGENKKTFNYLFARTRYAKNLTIKNLEGYAILDSAGSHEGHIENISLKNLVCKSLLCGAGSENGKVEKVHLEDLRGNYIFESAGKKGSIKNVTGKNIVGDRLFSEAGEEGSLIDISFDNLEGEQNFLQIARNKGSAENITLTNCRGDSLLIKVGFREGKIKNLSLSNSVGNNILSGAGTEKGTIENIALFNCSGYGIFKEAGTAQGTLQNIVLQKINSNGLFFRAGSKYGVVKNVAAINIQGIKAFEYVGHTYLPEPNKTHFPSEKIVIINYQGTHLLSHAGGYKTPVVNVLTEGQLLSQAFEYANIQNILSAENISDKRKKILEEIKNLAADMVQKNSFEQEKMHNEIAQLQEELFAGDT